MSNNALLGHPPARWGVASDLVPVTPSDDDALSEPAIALYVETGGDICFVSWRGAERTVAVPDNGHLQCAVRQVKATGTTASGIHALLP